MAKLKFKVTKVDGPKMHLKAPRESKFENLADLSSAEAHLPGVRVSSIGEINVQLRFIA